MRESNLHQLIGDFMKYLLILILHDIWGPSISFNVDTSLSLTQCEMVGQAFISKSNNRIVRKYECIKLEIPE